MSKIAGIRERIVKFWQSYNLWAFIALIFMFIIVGWIAEHRSGAYHCLGIAATLLSIVLGIIVIIYTMAQTIKGEINQHEMRNLMEKIEDTVQVVVKDVGQIKDTVLNNPPAQVEAKGEKVGDGIDSRYIGKGKIFYNFLGTSDIARLFAYFLLRSNKLNKTLSTDQFISIVNPLLKMPKSEVETYALGILQGMVCGLENYLVIVSQKNVRLKELPENFEEHMKIVVEWMKNRNPSLEVYLRKIDDIQ